jgi:hypothetical protein
MLYRMFPDHPEFARMRTWLTVYVVGVLCVATFTVVLVVSQAVK